MHQIWYSQRNKDLVNVILLNLIPLNEHIYGRNKTINIKNWTFYFYNSQIDLKDFDARLLKIDKKDYKDIDIYYIGYVAVKKIADCNNINSVNPLYLMINEMIGHFECNSIECNSIEEKMRISI